MKYLKNTIILMAVCLALNYFSIVNFQQLLSIEISVVIDTLLPCTFLLLFVNSLSAIRWVLTFNRFADSTIDLSTGLSVTFKSGLFAYFLPGQLGSELGRVVMTSRGKSSNELNQAVSAAIIDRVMALVSMILMSVLFITYALIGYYKIISVTVMLGVVVLLFILIIPISANVMRRIVFLLKKFRYVDYMGNIMKMIKNFVFRKPFFCFAMLIYSMILNMMVSFVTYLIVVNMIQPMNFSAVALMTLLSNLSSIIPLTPGGVGISEIVFRETGALVQTLAVENLAGGYIVFRLLNISSFIFGIILLGIYNIIFRKKIN